MSYHLVPKYQRKWFYSWEPNSYRKRYNLRIYMVLMRVASRLAAVNNVDLSTESDKLGTGTASCNYIITIKT